MRVLKSIFVTAIILVTASSLFAKNSDTSALLNLSKYPSVQPLFTAENELGHNPKGVLSADEVFALSLLFSECPLNSRSARLASQKFIRIKQEVTSQKYKKMSEEERGEAVLKLLYRDILIEYSENQSKINTLFETGYYNCVSSALVYMAAAKAAGLEVRGQKTPLHAFCSVYIKDKKTGKKHRIDVETTNPYGFNPGSTGIIENEQNMTMYYVVPEAEYSDRQEVSDKIFTGLVANNLCVDYLDNEDYFSAIPLMAAFYNLVINEKSAAQQQIRDDFYGISCTYMFNYTSDIDSLTSTEYAEIIKWFASFIKQWGQNDVMQGNMDSAFNNLLVLCFQEKSYDLADATYKELKSFLSPSQLPEIEEMITELFLLTKLDGVEPQKQIEIINDLLKSGSVTPEQRNRIMIELENVWLAVLTEHMDNYEFRRGYEDSLTAESQIPTSSVLKQVTQFFYTNCIVEIHNNFVIQINKGNYKEARKILEQGISDFPDDETLAQDLAIIRTLTY